jgi:hypothetical protein
LDYQTTGKMPVLQRFDAVESEAWDAQRADLCYCAVMASIAAPTDEPSDFSPINTAAEHSAGVGRALAALTFLARVGYAAKGIIFITLGLLAINGVIRSGDQAAALPVDQRIAVRAIRHGPLGSILVAAMCGGLLCYSAWQGGRAILDPQRHGRRWHALLRRGWYLWLALLNLALAASAAALAAGLASQGRYHVGTRDWSLSDITSTLLTSHLFRRTLVLSGLGALVFGVIRIGEALILQFKALRRPLDPPERLRRWRRRVQRLNLLSRGTVAAAVGVAMVLVGGYFNTAHDLERGYDIYQRVLHEKFSRTMLSVGGTGLLGWGVYCLFRASRPQWRSDLQDVQSS